jgi:hypothetical protein
VAQKQPAARRGFGIGTVEQDPPAPDADAEPAPAVDAFVRALVASTRQNDRAASARKKDRAASARRQDRAASASPLG